LLYCSGLPRYADKYGGVIQETDGFHGVTAAVNEPLGVIGIAAPAEFPLLGFISLVAPAVVRGNAVVAVPSQTAPLAVTDLYQVLDTSDLPGGVINIVTGQKDVLTKTLAEHQDVDSVWYSCRAGDHVGRYHVERLAADNMKRVFCPCPPGREDFMSQALSRVASDELLREASEVKNIWVPLGGE
jgi:aldehyde dehydrogenase (NAD+)